MPYDISKDYSGVPDGFGGVRLIPKPHLQHALDRYYRTRTTDALPDTTSPRTGFAKATRNQNTLPADCSDPDEVRDAKRMRWRRTAGWDQLPGLPTTSMPRMPSQEMSGGMDQEDPDEKVLGTLPEPPEGMTYRLHEGQDGSVAVVLCQDDGGNLTVNQNDNRRQMSDARTRSILHRMNLKHRAYFRDAATSEKTIFVHTPAKDEKLELREDPRFEGRWQVILVTPASNIIGDIPPGAEDFSKPENEDGDEQRQGGRSDTPQTGELRATSQRRTGDHATASKLRQMNVAAKRFWSGKAA